MKGKDAIIIPVTHRHCLTAVSLKLETKPEWFVQADTALKRAAERARTIAQRTNTAVHVIRDGKIVKLLPAQGQSLLREEAPEYGEKSERKDSVSRYNLPPSYT